MLIIAPEVRVPASQLDESMMLRLERCARICYKSEDKINEQHNSNFLQRIVASGHESVIEHEKVTVLFIIDRGISHELVRHRIGSYSQESTRYCNYSRDKFGNEITVIKPFFYKEGSRAYELWKESCLLAEKNYLELLQLGSSPWMDFNTGHKPAYMGNKTGYKKATVPIEKMGYTMMNHRMKTRVTEYYFQYTSGRRISFKHHLNLIPQGLKHMLPPL
jgi:hypothetical protein